ncbi:unnamed protein product [Symbiodinium sp. CCMP2592]|nr:unnamed protein product [Symbiodinium sp. CCMP2592]
MVSKEALLRLGESSLPWVLRTCSKSAGLPPASRTAGDPKRILSIFEELSKKPISVEILHTTGIGKEVNDRFFKNHADQEVREHCTELVRKWKDFALGKSASAAPAAAAAQKKPDSPPPRKLEKRAAEPPVKAKKIKFYIA